MDDDLMLNISVGPVFSEKPVTSDKNSQQNKGSTSLKRKLTNAFSAASKKFKPNDVSSTSNESVRTPAKKPLDRKEKLKPKKFTTNSMIEESESAIISRIMSDPVETHSEPIFSTLTFEQLGCLHPHLVSCLSQKLHLTLATEIQAKTINTLLSGKDILIKAQTGSGKTLAYALPVVQKLQAIDPPITRKDGIFALIITPTRELSTQTMDTFHTITRPFVRIVTTCLIGGASKKSEKVSIRKGSNILITTPKRLLDHMQSTANLVLNQLKWLVVDEADRMLELGFEKNIRAILDKIKSVCDIEQLQTVLLSATLTPGVETLSGLALNNPVLCRASEESGENSFALPSGLKHYLLAVPLKMRLVALAAFLLLKCRYNKKGGKVIVFLSTQSSVDFHHRLFNSTLCSSGEDLVLPEAAIDMSLFRLHGSMEHNERQSVFRSFSNCPSGVLLTTDVASRGLDISGVAWVVQYNAAEQVVDYVHRVGRTARAGGKGKALLFLQPGCEMGYVDRIAKVGIHLEHLELKQVLNSALFHVKNVYGKNKNKSQLKHYTLDDGVRKLQRMFENYVESEPGLKEIAEAAYISFIRSYASFSKDIREYFDFKQLHLGHVAKSFCLSEAPREIADKVIKKNTKEIKKGPSKKKENIPKKIFDVAKRNMMAEYGL